MNFQENLVEASSQLRSRLFALAASAIDAARRRGNLNSRVADLKKSFVVLNGARRQLRKVAGRHASHFVKQNATLVSAVRKDVSAVHDFPSRSDFHRRAHRQATVGDNGQYQRTAEVEATLEGVNP